MVKFPAEFITPVPTLAAAARDAASTHPTGSPRNHHRTPAPRWAATTAKLMRTQLPPGGTRSRSTPALVDRALRGHAMTQENALADLLRSQHLTPRSPQPGEPQFDIAWIDGQVLFVAEVKSLTKRNEEQQLRLGLGQVLRYRNLLANDHRTVVAVLALERTPSDMRWPALCKELGVLLVWFPFFEGL